MAIDNNPGGLGGLGGFLGGDFGDLMQAVGLSLMSSPRNAPLSGFGPAMQQVSAMGNKRQEREAMVALAIQAGFSPDEAKRLAVNPAILKMAIEQKTKQRADEFYGKNQLPPLPGMGGDTPDSPSPGFPAQPRQSPQRNAPLSAFEETDPAAGGEGRPSMIGQPMPTLAQPVSWSGQANDPNAVAALVYQKAQEIGVDPNLALGIAYNEGLNKNTLGNPTYGNKDARGYSFGPFQLYSGSPDPNNIRPGGMAYEFVQAYGEPPSAANVDKQIEFSLQRMKERGTGAWYAVRDRGGEGNIKRMGAQFAQRLGLNNGGKGEEPAAPRVQLASLGDQPVNLDGRPPGPVPSSERRSLDETAPGGFPPEQQNLVQLAQASGAMPSRQPPIRSIVPPTQMPGLNAFSPQGANEWRDPTAQTAPPLPSLPPRNAPTPTGSAREPYMRQYQQIESMLSAGEARFGDDKRNKTLERRLKLLENFIKPTDAEQNAIARGLTPGTPEYRQYIESATDSRPNEVRLFDAERNDPEFAARRERDRQSPELRRFNESQNNPAFQQWLAEQKKDPALKQKADMLMASGVPEQMAFGLASGRYEVNRHPINGSAQVVDKATGKIVFDGSSMQAAGASDGQAAPDPATRAASSTPQSSMPRDVDYSTATGVGGAYRNLVNTIVGAFGGPLRFDEAERASQAMTNLQIRTQTALQESIPGRPSNYLMQQLAKLAVGPNEISMGAARAAERYRQTRDMIKQEADRLDRDVLGRPSDYTPAQIAAARLNRSTIADVLRDYDAVLSAFARPSQGRTPRAPRAQGGNIPRVTSEQEYNALEPGARYIDPNGVERRKGSR
jgi:hypothetical protein